MPQEQIAAQEETQTEDKATNSGTDNVSLQEQDISEEQNQTLDLDRLDKFTFQGREYTPEELHKAILRQQDYSAKTQELAQKRKTLHHESPGVTEQMLLQDLEAVRRNPELADTFREKWPETFHRYLGDILGETPDNNRASNDDDAPMSREVKSLRAEIAKLQKKLARVDEIDQRFESERQQMADKKLAEVYGNLSSKYPLASEDSVTARANAAIEAGMPITEGLIERFFRLEHERLERIATERHKARVRSMKEKTKQATEGPAAGDKPKTERKRMSFTEAAELAISRMQKQN